MKQIKEIYQAFLNSTGVSTDTRQLEKDNIFFALRGENFDGNKFASSALDRGVSLAIIDNEDFYSKGCILVDDCLKTLQELARYHRARLDIPVIGLTGTNGKTTTKELIHLVLSKKYNCHATPGNLNNHIGVPLSILGIKYDTEIAIIEMGANHQGEIALLSKIAMPTHGLITNIGKAHLEGFGDFEGVIRAKTELYTYLKDHQGISLVNYDDPLLMKLSSSMNKLSYGSNDEADTRGNILASIPFLSIEWGGLQIDTQLYGDYNFDNIMAAIALGEMFKVVPTDVLEAICGFVPDNSRSQLLKSKSNQIYLDAYNANPSSMLASIQNFEKQDSNSKVLILGDMLELGESSLAEHKNIIEAVKDKFNTVLLVGPEFMRAGSTLGVRFFADTDTASAWLKENPLKDSYILVKGSRGIALEKLLDLL